MRISIQTGLFFILLLSACSCGTGGSEQTDWTEKTKHLEDAEKNFPAISGIATDVGLFYEALRHKYWKETYSRRSLVFQEDVTLDSYLKSVSSINWEFVDYEILSINIKSSNQVAVICKFIEISTGKNTSYNTVVWSKEAGVWRCDAAGPGGIPLFRKLRAE